MEWKRYKLSDFVVSIQTGPFGSQLHQSDYSVEGTPVIMPKDMVDGKIVERTIAHVSEEHGKRLQRYKVKVGDIIYSRRGDDTLIENNTKRIRLLEKMAENLYKEWFVRFPGHEKVEFAKSKYGKLPKTFEIVKMNEVFEYYIGGGWGEEERSVDFPEEASVIRGADFPNVWHYDVSSCPRRYHKAKNYKARHLEEGDIVMEISGGTSEQPVGRTVLVTKELINRFPEGRVKIELSDIIIVDNPEVKI